MDSTAYFGRTALRAAAFSALIAGLAYAVFFVVQPGNPVATLAPAEAQAAKSTTGAMAVGAVTGLPLPRFVSLKSDLVNVRRGAGTEHDVVWAYHRTGLPVEIIAEWDNWRRIRDADGADGWVFHRLLGGKRTALVAPWSTEAVLPLRQDDAADAAVAAQLQPKVLANVSACTGEWCRIYGTGFDGWIQQDLLFGVYPGEQFD
ncbi:SH3 domain-containing protein [Terrihabitans soli]|nr:SH3 domain-containing protein [Terrihabitans soli]